ncbi:hypothetical protein LX36DRAFT_731373 [Colletotrichum falcatum]|nr:hypothetical protein LX36DRAFT_731373 [Colletotrichum falcatum]
MAPWGVIICMDARRHITVPAHPDTCEWLFRSSEYRGWMDAACMQVHDGVFWIKGKPGAGKSTLMKHAFHHFQRSVGWDYTLVSYFFNVRGETLEKTPLGMLRSIVYQLLQTNDTLYMNFRRYFFILELQGFIRWAVLQPLPKPLPLLIDALDECNESDVRDAVKFLESLSILASQAKNRLKICLSSRHHPSITTRKAVDTLTKRLTLGDAGIESEVRRKANGILLWDVIVVSLLNKSYDEGRVEAMWTTLEEVPAGLEAMLSAIPRKDVSNASTTNLTFHMLQWVIFSFRLLGIRRNRLYSDSVQLIHLSVGDFLLRYKRLQMMDATPGPEPCTVIHDRLGARC